MMETGMRFLLVRRNHYTREAYEWSRRSIYPWRRQRRISSPPSRSLLPDSFLDLIPGLLPFTVRSR